MKQDFSIADLSYSNDGLFSVGFKVLFTSKMKNKIYASKNETRTFIQQQAQAYIIHQPKMYGDISENIGMGVRIDTYIDL